MDEIRKRSLAWGSLRRQKMAAGDAVAILSGRRSGTDFARLQQMANNHDPLIRQAAINSLVETGGLEAMNTIVRLMNDRCADVRAAACKALGALRAHRNKDMLYDALHDEDVQVQCAGASALAMMGDKTGLDRVVQLLKHKGPYQYHALRTFNHITRQRFTVNAQGAKSAYRWYKMRKRLMSS